MGSVLGRAAARGYNQIRGYSGDESPVATATISTKYGKLTKKVIRPPTRMLAIQPSSAPEQFRCYSKENDSDMIECARLNFPVNMNDSDSPNIITTQVANELLWFQQFDKNLRKIAVFPISSSKFSIDDFTWLRGNDFTDSLIYNVAIYVECPVGENGTYLLCICDSVDGCSNKISLNKQMKTENRNVSTVSTEIDNIIKLRESGVIDNLLKNGLSKESFATTFAAAVSAAAVSKHLVEMNQDEIMLLVVEEYNRLESDGKFSRLPLGEIFLRVLEYVEGTLRSVNTEGKSVSWVRPYLVVHDVFFNKSYSVKEEIYEVNGKLQKEIPNVIYRTLPYNTVLLQNTRLPTGHSDEFLLMGADTAQRNDDQLVGQGYSKCPARHQHRKFIFVYTLDSKLFISSERFHKSAGALHRLAHSQLAHGLPVLAAGELIMEFSVTEENQKKVRECCKTQLVLY